MSRKVFRRNKKKEKTLKRLISGFSVEGSEDKSFNLEFMLDCSLIKEFKILPSSVDKTLDELYFVQKKMLAQIAGNSLDTTDLKKLLNCQSLFQEVEEMADKEFLHPAMLEGLIKDMPDKDEREKEITRRAKIIKETRKREIYEYYFANKKEG